MSTLYITTQGSNIQRRSGQIVVCKGKDVLQNIPETHVKQMTLVGNINLSTPTISFCLENQIEVVFLSQGGKFRGRLNGEANRSAEARREQYNRVLDKDFCLVQARAFISGKVQNQIAVARRQIGSNAAPREFETLKSNLKKIETAKSLESLLGLEGSASASYFKLFGTWIPQPFSFNKRTSNPPKDEVNALLSLSYTLLYNRITTNLNLAGLDAYLGFFHQARNGHAALASDLLEEFRQPIADALVLKLIRRKQLNITSFERPNGEIRLTHEGKKVFFAEFEEKMKSKRQTDAGDNWSLPYSKIIERQIHHFARVISGEDKVYKPFILK
jgi:CRISP-associated protein Cas1